MQKRLWKVRIQFGVDVDDNHDDETLVYFSDLKACSEKFKIKYMDAANNHRKILIVVLDRTLARGFNQLFVSGLLLPR